MTLYSSVLNIVMYYYYYYYYNIWHSPPLLDYNCTGIFSVYRVYNNAINLKKQNRINRNTNPNSHISDLQCRNEQQGCKAAFPVSEEFLHTALCPFELLPCPHQGCEVRVTRKDAQVHFQTCSHWRELCPMGCGTPLSRATQAKHNCYQELKQRYETRRQSQHNIAVALRRKMLHMQRSMAQMNRQIALICESMGLDEGTEEEESPGEGTSAAGSSHRANPSSSTHTGGSESSTF